MLDFHLLIEQERGITKKHTTCCSIVSSCQIAIVTIY